MSRGFGFAAGCVVGLLASLWSCSPPPQGFGTSLFITARWNGDAQVYGLYFVGQVDGRDAFPRSLRPEQFPATPLSVPEKVRVLLADDLVGQTVTVVIYGYDQDGNLLAQGQAVSPAVVAGDEVSMTVLLDRESPVDSGTGGGVGGGSGGGATGGATGGGLGGATGGGAGGATGGGTGGATGGGTGGATGGGTGGATGGGTGGGPADAGCGCGTTCCSSPNVCASPTQLKVGGSGGLTFPLASCGQVQSTCSYACDPMTAATCSANVCSCGSKVCGAGTRCAVNGGGTFDCVCDTASNCAGCCKSNVCVATGAGTGVCGNAGNQCTSCQSGETCQPGGTCGGGPVISACSSGSCKSADACVNTQFPTCRSGSNFAGPCVACDVLRSDRCGLIGQCMCGGSASCPADQYCNRNVVPVVCSPLPH